jgi:murein DD-endopeptidase MepM/ murein hydrolase activator NlpD
VSYLKRLSLKSILLVLNFTSFFLFIIFYIVKKVRTTTTFISRQKNWLVKTLMWRRGLLFRPATHGGVVALAVIAILFGSIFGKSGVQAQNLSSDEGSVLQTQTSSETILPQNRPRTEILSYEVKGGDTISTIAASFNISNDTILWSNDIKDVSDIQPGQILKIPPVTGVLHTVKSGETLVSVAKKYQADAQTIADFPGNSIDDSFSIKSGQQLVVPNGEIAVAQPARAAVTPRSGSGLASSHGSGQLRWPLSGGISQYASFFHPGAIDITNSVGTPIGAADSGRVITVEKLGYGYGWHVIIDHGNGLTSLYAHMSALYVSVGQNVSKGQTVGALGLTGRTTGPHLHFETRRNGAPVNPLSLLP